MDSDIGNSSCQVFTKPTPSPFLSTLVGLLAGLFHVFLLPSMDEASEAPSAKPVGAMLTPPLLLLLASPAIMGFIFLLRGFSGLLSQPSKVDTPAQSPSTVTSA